MRKSAVLAGVILIAIFAMVTTVAADLPAPEQPPKAESYPRILAPSMNPSDRFGWSVDVDESSVGTFPAQPTFAFGAPTDDAGSADNEEAVDTGVVYLNREGRWYTLNAGKRARAGDYFGWDVAVDGEWIAVGAPGRDKGDSEGVGMAYLFRRDAWDALSDKPVVITPEVDIHAGDAFGAALDMEDGLLVVAAPNFNAARSQDTDTEDEPSCDTGAVSIFRFNKNQGKWVRQKTVIDDDRGYYLQGRPRLDGLMATDLGADTTSPVGWIHDQLENNTVDPEQFGLDTYEDWAARIWADMMRTWWDPAQADHVGSAMEGPFKPSDDPFLPFEETTAKAAGMDIGIGRLEYGAGADQAKSLPQTDARYGAAVATDGRVVAVGAPNEERGGNWYVDLLKADCYWAVNRRGDPPGDTEGVFEECPAWESVGHDAGAVYIYWRTKQPDNDNKKNDWGDGDDCWQRVVSNTGDNNAKNEHFGQALAVGPNMVIVGAPGAKVKDEATGDKVDDAGAVDIFMRNEPSTDDPNPDWYFVERIENPRVVDRGSKAKDDFFGYDLALDAGETTSTLTIYVPGAGGAKGDWGVAYQYGLSHFSSEAKYDLAVSAPTRVSFPEHTPEDVSWPKSEGEYVTGPMDPEVENWSEDDGQKEWLKHMPGAIAMSEGYIVTGRPSHDAGDLGDASEFGKNYGAAWVYRREPYVSAPKTVRYENIPVSAKEVASVFGVGGFSLDSVDIFDGVGATKESLEMTVPIEVSQDLPELDISTGSLFGFNGIPKVWDGGIIESGGKIVVDHPGVVATVKVKPEAKLSGSVAANALLTYPEPNTHVLDTGPMYIDTVFDTSDSKLKSTYPSFKTSMDATGKFDITGDLKLLGNWNLWFPDIEFDIDNVYHKDTYPEKGEIEPPKVSIRGGKDTLRHQVQIEEPIPITDWNLEISQVVIEKMIEPIGKRIEDGELVGADDRLKYEVMKRYPQWRDGELSVKLDDWASIETDWRVALMESDGDVSADLRANVMPRYNILWKASRPVMWTYVGKDSIETTKVASEFLADATINDGIQVDFVGDDETPVLVTPWLKLDGCDASATCEVWVDLRKQPDAYSGSTIDHLHAEAFNIQELSANVTVPWPNKSLTRDFGVSYDGILGFYNDNAPGPDLKNPLFDLGDTYSEAVQTIVDNAPGESSEDGRLLVLSESKSIEISLDELKGLQELGDDTPVEWMLPSVMLDPQSTPVIPLRARYVAYEGHDFRLSADSVTDPDEDILNWWWGDNQGKWDHSNEPYHSPFADGDGDWSVPQGAQDTTVTLLAQDDYGWVEKDIAVDVVNPAPKLWVTYDSNEQILEGWVRDDDATVTVGWSSGESGGSITLSGDDKREFEFEGVPPSTTITVTANDGESQRVVKIDGTTAEGTFTIDPAFIKNDGSIVLPLNVEQGSIVSTDIAEALSIQHDAGAPFSFLPRWGLWEGAAPFSISQDGDFELDSLITTPGPYFIPFTASDHRGSEVNGDVKVQVGAPVAPRDDHYAVDEDPEKPLRVMASELPGAGPLFNDCVDEGVMQTLEMDVVESPLHGEFESESNGAFKYWPDKDFFGQDSFVYRTLQPVRGSGERTVEGTATVWITVLGTQDAPVGNEDVYVTLEDEVLVVDPRAGVLANDVDVDRDRLTATLIKSTVPDGHSVSLEDSETGAFVYTPKPDWPDCDGVESPGSVELKYRLDDGVIKEPIEVGFSITVEAVNDPPRAKKSWEASSHVEATEDETLTVTWKDHFKDPEGDSFEATLTAQSSTSTVLVNDDGSLSFLAQEDYFGPAEFAFLLMDTRDPENPVYSEPMTVTVDVKPVDDYPRANNDRFLVGCNRSLIVTPPSGVLANDIEVDGDDLYVEMLSTPEHGEIEWFDEYGRFKYEPPENTLVEDQFVYRVSDGKEGSLGLWDVGIVTINVCDTEPPTSTVEVPDPLHDEGQLHLVAADAYSGISQIVYWLDDSEPTSETVYLPVGGSAPTTHTVDVDVSGYGSHTIYHFAIDGAGVREETRTAAFDITYSDTVAPTTTCDAPQKWVNHDVLVSLSATDSAEATQVVSGVAKTRIKIDSDPATDYASPILFSSEGTTTLKYWSVDVAGNIEARKTATVSIDKTPPVVSHMLWPAYWFRGMEVQLIATDGLSDVAAVLYSLDGSEETTYLAPIQVADNGVHTVEYRCVDTAGNKSVTSSVEFWVSTDRVERISGPCRYTTAIEIARTGFDPSGDGSWPGVTDVIIASGEDRAAADALAAGGLSWAYEAPLVLVGADDAHSEVKWMLREIVEASDGTVTLRVVGGPAAVSDGCIERLRDAVGRDRVVVDRLMSVGSRYDTAEEIARRVRIEWKRRDGFGAEPDTVLIANGADPERFFDALALSTVSAAQGYPVLYVQADAVPMQTSRQVTQIKPKNTIVGGGPVAVSEDVRKSLSATRWSGANRYETAVEIAQNAGARDWISYETVAVASCIPDSLSGGTMLGRSEGVLLLTSPDRLPSVTGLWVGDYSWRIADCYVLGGQVSVSPEVEGRLGNALQ